MWAMGIGAVCLILVSALSTALDAANNFTFVPPDQTSIAGVGVVARLSWWGAASLLGGVLLGYLAVVGDDLRTGLAWLAVVLVVIDVLYLIGGLEMTAFGSLPLTRSSPHWTVSTTLAFQYWSLAALLGSAAASIVVGRMARRRQAHSAVSAPE